MEIPEELITALEVPALELTALQGVPFQARITGDSGGREGLVVEGAGVGGRPESYDSHPAAIDRCPVAERRRLPVLSV
ncbi:hypothetical protein [Streptomyces sp. NPDC086835]|uniref:hypothetical protein n=1 Tax=Streptomyces sp. NPDC086835 TaxID=3365761 RepID=UPI00380F7C14